MTRTQTSGKQKDTRTQIVDLPETAVELSEREMRIVSGGLASKLASCYTATATVGGLADKTQYNTNGDWDTDWGTSVALSL